MRFLRSDQVNEKSGLSGKNLTALMLSLTIRLYKRYHTLDLDEISARLRKEGL